MSEGKKFLLEVCVGTSCHLMGAEDVLGAIKRLPQEKQALVELAAVTCLKQCGKGPNIRFDGQIYSEMNPEKLTRLLKEKLVF